LNFILQIRHNKIDIISCRNKLIEFDEDDGEYSIKRVSYSLSRGGYTVRVEFEK